MFAYHACAVRRSDARFFFSSRRRHTRSYGDWSSDVCSSDLPETRDRIMATSLAARWRFCDAQVDWAKRSEERRVGKEWRSGWSPDRYKNNEGNEQRLVDVRTGVDLLEPDPRGPVDERTLVRD